MYDVYENDLGSALIFVKIDNGSGGAPWMIVVLIRVVGRWTDEWIGMYIE